MAILNQYQVKHTGQTPNRVSGRVTLLAIGACLLVMALVPAGAQAIPNPTRPFEIVPGSFHLTPSTTQAAAHGDLTTAFDFAHSPATGKVFNDVRTIVVNLPPGFSGNNTAVPTCTVAQLINLNTQAVLEQELRGELGGGNLSACPIASQIGQVSFECTGCTQASTPQKVTVPLYNMEVTSFGVTVELGFRVTTVTQILLVSVRPGDSGITITTPNIEKIVEARNASVTVWGEPASHSHDTQRGEVCLGETMKDFVGTECRNEFGGSKPANIPVKPFLSNPTSCGPHIATMEAYSWEEPEKPSTATAEVGPIGECERVPFDPSIESQLTTESAESPTGLDLSILVPQTWENPFSIATSNLKDAKVSLPVGVTVNPSAGSGLGACTPQQYEAETSSSPPGAGCPPESKIGSIEIETPVLAEKINGAVYVAKPFDNPFGSLLSLYVVAKNAARGIVIKVAGRIEPDPVTGQLVTTFLNNPEQPFNRLTLKFRPGATAPLVSPPACGSYTTQGDLTPWSAPTEPRLVRSSFQITKGVHEGACPSGGVPPFKPQVISGTQNNNGGFYSPFYLRIIREDGEEEITKFTTVFPPGLTGNLSGIPFCSDTQIEAARGATGLQEMSGPLCPPASEIGHTIVGAGVGTVLAQTPGKVYLAGPYHGSALSIVSITSATVGPFDLGTVVIRFALRINQTTAQVEVDSTGSDPIPHIIDGIVVHVRDIHVYIDRSKFILNPTSCDPMSIADTITGAGADYTYSAGQVPVTVTTPFQAANCSRLAFKPAFKVSTSGKTSRPKGASLSVKLTYPNTPQGTQANIRSVKVDLPKQLPSRLTTLQKACPDSTFNANPAACPVASRVGRAKALTPILPVPLIGPAYFVSHGGAKFPELIIVLQGYGFTIDLHGETFINKKGITSSTFHAVPDQPVTSFDLTLPQGRDSALAANGNLCKSKLKMPTAFTAQNGFVIHRSTPVSVTGCAKHKAKKARRARKNHRHNMSRQEGKR